MRSHPEEPFGFAQGKLRDEGSMKTKELKDLAVTELLDKEKNLYVELSKLNLQRYTGRVEKPHKFALIRKDIARIRTILNQKKDK